MSKRDIAIEKKMPGPSETTEMSEQTSSTEPDEPKLPKQANLPNSEEKQEELETRSELDMSKGKIVRLE